MSERTIPERNHTDARELTSESELSRGGEVDAHFREEEGLKEIWGREGGW